MKNKRFVPANCTRCGAQLPPLKITCPACGKIDTGIGKPLVNGRPDDGIKRLSEVTSVKIERILTNFVDRNWGTDQDPGIAYSSVTMIGGAPGSGKSTLCLQLLAAIAKVVGRPGLYVGAEESGEQIKDRAARIGIDTDAILILGLEEQVAGYKLTRDIFKHWNPSGFVIDSIQKYAATDAEAIDICSQCKEIAILQRSPGFIISQVNKEEEIAGSNEAQHEVDALITFTLTDVIVDGRGKDHLPPVDPGEQVQPFRVMKTGKNRFGAPHESYFSMHTNGLRPFTLPTKGKR